MTDEPIEFRIHDFSSEHLQGYHSLRSNRDVMQYVPFPFSHSLEESKQSLFIALRNPAEHLFAVYNKAEKVYVGLAGISQQDDQAIGEIGCMLLPNYWGKGCAKIMARWLITYGFSQLAFTKIIAICDSRNFASEKIMLACGMEKEEHRLNGRCIDGVFSDEFVYAINIHS